MIKLWGRLSSINVQKVAWCLDELGLPYERVEAGGQYGIVDTPEYRAMNPNGLVPTIEIDGFVMWESNAIVRHLAAEHGAGTLWPADRLVRADADRWMDWQNTSGTPALRDAFMQLVRTPPGGPDREVVRLSAEKSDRMAAILDERLADRPYLAGESFTVADIACGAQAHRWLHLPIDRSPRPHLEAWYARLRERPGSRQALTLPLT